jgi:hypothetical protein
MSHIWLLVVPLNGSIVIEEANIGPAGWKVSPSKN